SCGGLGEWLTSGVSEGRGHLAGAAARALRPPSHLHAHAFPFGGRHGSASVRRRSLHALAPALRSDEAVVAPRGPPAPPATRSPRTGEGGAGLRADPAAAAPAPPSPAPWGRCPRAPAAHVAPPPCHPSLSPCPSTRSQNVAQRGADPVGVRGHASDRPTADGVRLVFRMASIFI
ncbi:hypothetical protein LEMLEM_LOCUS8348, partial [Lemmus lemmus]